MPPPPAKPIAEADLQGEWTATDIDGWTYSLSIHSELYSQRIIRTTGGPCEQKGTLQWYEKAYGSPYVAPQTGMGMEPYGGATYGAAPAANTSARAGPDPGDPTSATRTTPGRSWSCSRTSTTARTSRCAAGSATAARKESRRYQRLIPTAADPTK